MCTSQPRRTNNDNNNTSKTRNNNNSSINSNTMVAPRERTTNNHGNSRTSRQSAIRESLMSSGGVTGMLSVASSTASSPHHNGDRTCDSNASPRTSSSASSRSTYSAHRSLPSSRNSSNNYNRGFYNNNEHDDLEEEDFHLSQEISATSLATSHDDESSAPSALLHSYADETLLTNDGEETEDDDGIDTNTNDESINYNDLLNSGQIPLANPATMSDEALHSELEYRGVQTYNVRDRSQLEQAVVFARKSSSGTNDYSPRSSSNDESNKDNNNNNNGPKRSPPPPPPPPKTSAKAKDYVPSNIRLRSGDSSCDPINSNNGNNLNKKPPGHIPLTSQNRIPPQILHILRTSADRALTSINLASKHIGDAEVAKLSEALLTNRTVQALHLEQCKLTDAGVASLCELLQSSNNDTLKELYLDGNAITTEGAAKLSTALITNEVLKVLSLSDNVDIGDRGVVYLIGCLEHNSTLITLEVENCGCSTTGGSSGSGNGGNNNKNNRKQQIASILHSRQIDSNFESLLERLRDDDFRVTGIDLSGRQIGLSGISRLAEALADNNQVRQLWLRGCNINDDGAVALASCLEQNMTIVDLFLGNNSVGDEGLNAISDALALSNLTLVSLEMDENEVGVRGIEYFTKALEKNTSLLVASFDNAELGVVGGEGAIKLESLQKLLGERRNGLNLVSFVVDPDGASTMGTANEEGVVNMSVCSSFMPSTYRRAGFSSVAGTSIQKDVRGSFRSNNQKGMASHTYSIYNKVKNQQDERADQVAGAAAVVAPPPQVSQVQKTRPNGNSSDESTARQRRRSPPTAPSPKAQSVELNPQRATSQAPQSQIVPTSATSLRRELHKDMELRKEQQQHHQQFSTSDSALERQRRQQQNNHIHRPSENRHPLHQSLVPIAERSQSSSQTSTKNSGRSGKSGRDQGMVPMQDKPDQMLMPMQDKPIVNGSGQTIKTEPSTDDEHEDDKTSRNFDSTLKKLLGRVEVMRHMNRFTAAHYRARHFWLCFIPISFSICMAGILSLASAVNISGSSRVALSIFTGLFALFAFVLNFFQMRFGWSSRAEVHRSVEMELAQVAFQLDTLRRYDNGQLCSSSVSYKARSSAIRDLYRIEVYLQAVMKCTPQVPDRINEAFSLLASRLKSICLKYPHAVKLRLANGAYDDEQSDPTNPVPVDMQSDALEVLGKEIRNYYLFPMFMPKPVDVVSRTIDLFFAKPPRTEHKDDTIYEEEYSEYSDEEEDDHKYSQNDIV